MIKIFLILFIPFSLFGSKILSYNIYNRTDRVDIMLTFDTPYEGVIKQKRTNSSIIIKLQDSTIESPKIKKISSKFINSITINPLQNNTQIVAKLPISSTRLLASKTADGYGLRLRFTNKTATQHRTTTMHQNTQQSTSLNLPTKKETSMRKNYIIVSMILFIGVIILLYLKKKTAPKQQKNTKSTWLFQQTAQQETATQSPVAKQPQNPQDENRVTIRFQQNIDEFNSVVMLDFLQESYLVFMGKNNTFLLEKFHENKPTTQDEFESILQSKHEQLNQYIDQNTATLQQLRHEDSMATYTKNAAIMSYNENAKNI